MSGDTPLTALCAICHVGPLKYTCPRCGIHTCSLPCVKLHKARASCSGIRDPTAYRKRADLTTASSIDSDFNFITSLERSLARNDDEHTNNSDIQAAGLARVRQTDSARLERLVKEQGVAWRRAPKGMRRRQENDTRIEHSTVTWTLEFMLADGSRKLCSISDTRTIGEALELAVRPPTRHLGKRKRHPARAADEDQVEPHGSEAGPESKQDKATSPTGISKNVPGQKAQSDDQQQPTIPASHSSNMTAGGPTPSDPITNNDADLFADQQLYLLRPNTPSKLKVLKAIRRSDKLVDILRGRVVMEFPTLYVKTEPPDELAAPFMAEEVYLRDHGEDVVPLADDNISKEIEGKESGGIDEEEEDGEIAELHQDLKRDTEEVIRALTDPSKVISVLEQDISP
jgi:hypothetical protein